MKMNWEKLGRIFSPEELNVDWIHSYATIPIADQLEGDLYKIYFTPRDKLNRSHVAWVVIDMNNPLQVLDCSKEPVLAPGNLGGFDDSGAMANCLVTVEDKKYLYYQGCNLGVTVPFRNSIGLAISEDNGKTFNKIGLGPIIDRTYKEPYFTATPSVIYENGIFRAWYLSCVKWILEDGVPKHYYHLKYAESGNGIDWKREGIVAIDFKNDEEYAIGVPRVIKEGNIYKMWYCYRGHKYRIGYAESKDGISWQRKDEVMENFTVSEHGWDSEMVEYPFILDFKDDRYMFYNGNHYGKTGIGIARLIK